MDLRMSPASMDDVFVASALTQENMRCYYERYGIEWHAENFVREWHALENYVIFEADNPAGYLSLSVNGYNLYVRDLQLGEKYTGKGIGTWIVFQVVSIARRRNLQSIRLRVFNDNPARYLYQRLGFHVVGSEPNVLRMERDVVP